MSDPSATLTPGVRLIRAAVADNTKVVEFLLKHSPECKEFISHAICGIPNPKKETFRALVNAASDDDLTITIAAIEMTQSPTEAAEREKWVEGAKETRKFLRNELAHRAIAKLQGDPEIEI